MTLHHATIAAAVFFAAYLAVVMPYVAYLYATGAA